MIIFNLLVIPLNAYFIGRTEGWIQAINVFSVIVNVLVVSRHLI